MNDYEDAQKVKKRYLTILNDMAKNRDSYVKNPEKDFTRKRKLSFQDTINTIVTYDAGSIGRCIKRYIPKVEKTPTTSAFLQQQKKLKLSAFQTLFYRFNDRFQIKLCIIFIFYLLMVLVSRSLWTE